MSNIPSYIPRSLVLILCASFIWAKALAQPIKASAPEDIKAYGYEKLEEGDYVNAATFLEQAFETDQDLSVAYDAAVAYESYRDYRKAEIWYKRIFRKDQGVNHPDARFRYARMLKVQAKYDEAQQEFYQVLTTTEDEALKEKIRNELIGVELALTGEEPLDVFIKNAGGDVNSAFSEYSPSLDSEGTLYFGGYMRKDAIVLNGEEDDYHAKIYSVKLEKEEEVEEPKSTNGRRARRPSRNKKSEESKATPLSKLINREDYHTSNVSITDDGQRMYFTRALLNSNLLDESVIYLSENIDGQWGGPDPIARVNGEYLATHPIEGELFGNRVLYFSANMEGGQGGMDLYYSTISADGSYALPVNLGEIVNTSGDEITPYYRNGILYFSSDMHPGLGAMDIFSSQWNGTEWSEPKNIGKGYNTSMDDTYFRIDDTGYEGFVVSNRPGSKAVSGKKTCCDDIYILSKKELIIDLMAGTVDQNNKALQGATIKLIDVTSGEQKVQFQERDYLFSFPLTEEREYKAVAIRAGYESDSVYFDTKGITETQTIQKKLTLKKEKVKEPKKNVNVVSRNETIRLRNIYYDFDDDKILLDAEKDLNVLLGLLAKYPTMVIELSSHTDSQGEDAYNEKLSQRRANSARQWLLNKGVNPDRVVPKGYGERFILNQCENGVECTDEEHRYNRRTEFKMISGPEEIEISRSTTSGGGGGIPSDQGASQKPASPSSGPQMKFEVMEVDLGTISYGETKSYSYTFTNTGDKDLIIEHASACTCTEVDWPTLPIPAGTSKTIDIVYDSAKKEGDEALGQQEVMVEMITNTKERFVDLTFLIMVVKK